MLKMSCELSLNTTSVLGIWISQLTESSLTSSVLYHGSNQKFLKISNQKLQQSSGYSSVRIRSYFRIQKQILHFGIRIKIHNGSSKFYFKTIR
jgi:hypothetical protein